MQHRTSLRWFNEDIFVPATDCRVINNSTFCGWTTTKLYGIQCMLINFRVVLTLNLDTLWANLYLPLFCDHICHWWWFWICMLCRHPPFIPSGFFRTEFSYSGLRIIPRSNGAKFCWLSIASIPHLYDVVIYHVIHVFRLSWLLQVGRRIPFPVLFSRIFWHLSLNICLQLTDLSELLEKSLTLCDSAFSCIRY